MPKSIPHLNEIVSLTVMLLMLVALVAGQADATAQDSLRRGAASDSAPVKPMERPYQASITAHIVGAPIMISIDAVAEFSHFRLEDE